MPWIAALVVLSAAVVACGDDASPPPTGDAATGESLFEQRVLGSNPGCVTCHSLRAGVTLVGPSLADIGADAGARVEGQDAATYLLQSIVEPMAFVVEGYEPDRMPSDWSEQLSEEEIDALVSFLLTRSDA